MRVAINIPNVPKGRVAAHAVSDVLPDIDKLSEFITGIIPAVLPVTFRLDNKGATITFDD